MQASAVPPPPGSGVFDDIRPGMNLPSPEEGASAAARARLSAVDLGVAAPTVTALGTLSDAVAFVAAVQGSAYPRPFLSTRVLLLTGAHLGGIAAGPAPDPRNAMPLQHLAVAIGAGIVTLEWSPAAAPIEHQDAISTDQMDAALRAGWLEADRAADEGIELLVLAAGGAGATTAAAAVVAAVTGGEPPALLSRVTTPYGQYDDVAWMNRCLALRDALHRVRDRDGDPRTVLSALGGADIAAATGLILGAASRRTPVMIDGPVGAAAALLARDFAENAARWVLMADHGRHPAVRLAAVSLELNPWLDLNLELGEGAAALTALPMLQMALTLAGAGEPAVGPNPPVPAIGRAAVPAELLMAPPLMEATTADHLQIPAIAAEPADIPPDAPAASPKPASAQRASDAEPATIVSAVITTDAKAGDAQPADAKAADPRAADAKASPAKSAETKQAETKPADAKSTDAKSTGLKPGDAKPADPKPGDAKPGDAKLDSATPGSVQPDESKLGDSKPGDTNASDTKAGDTKAGDTKAGDARPGDTRPTGRDSRPGKSETRPGSSRSGGPVRNGDSRGPVKAPGARGNDPKAPARPVGPKPTDSAAAAETTGDSKPADASGPSRPADTKNPAPKPVRHGDPRPRTPEPAKAAIKAMRAAGTLNGMSLNGAPASDAADRDGNRDSSRDTGREHSRDGAPDKDAAATTPRPRKQS